MELYNKYRPTEFDQVYGNELAVKSIKSELDAGHNVFLISGNSGNGKTTLAKIAAKYVGATELSTVYINASSDRGIDAIREIIDQSKMVPAGGGKTAFILDEVHGITAAAQEALLIALEDCPEHCYFFLCTTNPEKLTNTLKRRCSKVELKPVTDEQMLKLLKIICHKEQKTVSVDVLNRLVSVSNGSCGQAVKALGEVLYLETDQERLDYINSKNLDDQNKDVIELCRSMIRGEGWNKYVQCLENAKADFESNPESVRQLVMSYATSILKKGSDSSAAGKAAVMLQVFANTDCFRNGKYGIYVALLDYVDALK